MLVCCRGSEAVSEYSKFTGNSLDYFKFIRQVEDQILSLYGESDPAHALHLLLKSTSGRAYKLISGCINNITGMCKNTLALLDSGAGCHLIFKSLYICRLQAPVDVLQIRQAVTAL